MSFSFKYLIISIFIILAKTEIEIGPCIDNQRKILFENGTTYTYGFCSECDPGYFTKYFNNKDFIDLDCEKCPENSNNYGNDVVIDTFSEKILRRYPPTIEVECNSDDKSLCPKLKRNLFSLKLENIKDNIDSKSSLKWEFFYNKDGKIIIKYINYNGDINRYILIYINKILVYKDDTRHSTVKTVEFDMDERYNDVEIQYIIDKNISPQNSDIESFFEIFEIKMTNAEVSSLDCQKYDEINILKNSTLNNCDYYVDKCSKNDICTFRFFTEKSEGSNINEGSQIISYNKIEEGICNNITIPSDIEIDAEQCSYGQLRAFKENNNNIYFCDNCPENTYNNKLINYEISCKDDCDLEKKEFKKILYINNFADQSQYSTKINIIENLGYLEINYEKFNLREDAIIFCEIDDLGNKTNKTNKTFQLINPNDKSDINDGKFIFKIPFKKGQYNFEIKGKNLKLKIIKIINSDKGGNYNCTDKLNPDEELICKSDEYYSSNSKSCQECQPGSRMDKYSYCNIYEHIINNKFILDNFDLRKNKLFKNNYIIDGQNNTKYYLYLNPSFPLIYLTKSDSSFQVIGNEYKKIKVVRGIKERGIIFAYSHLDNNYNVTTYVYVKCNKSASENDLKFIKEETKENEKYFYFLSQSKISCPYCLESDIIREDLIDGSCSLNNQKIYRRVVNDTTQCVIKYFIWTSDEMEINNNSEILLFHNSSLSEDEYLLKIYEINEEIPIFNEKDNDKIVTDEKHYVECENNRKDPPIGLYITLIVIASVFALGLIIFIIIYIMRKRRRRLEEEDITSDGPKELNLKTTVKEDD